MYQKPILDPSNTIEITGVRERVKKIIGVGTNKQINAPNAASAKETMNQNKPYSNIVIKHEISHEILAKNVAI